jgi:GAF domain-containing protein
MTREQELMRSLVDMADTLVDDFDVVDLLTGLAERCVSLLDVSAAGVMLAGLGGDLRLVASSSETMRIVETFELQAREGPCLDAYRSGNKVSCDDLTAPPQRWPRFGQVAVEAGFMSTVAVPLRLRDRTVGALNLFKTAALALGEEDLLVARAFADLAAISVLQHRAAIAAQLVNEQLERALSSRVLIEQAKGVVFERAGIDMSEAFNRLRGYARSHNLILTEVAQAAIDGTLDVRAWRSDGGSKL